MKKLSLKVEDLRVVSFVPSSEHATVGTVQGHAYPSDDCNTPQYMCVSAGNTCDASCGSCLHTCAASCGGTCDCGPTGIGAWTCPPECYD